MIVLGQEQDSDGGSFKSEQSFVGEMANVNVWGTALTQEHISRLSGSCAVGTGDVMQWSGATGGRTVGVKEDLN